MKFLVLTLVALFFNVAATATIPSNIAKRQTVDNGYDDGFFGTKDPVWDEGYPLPECPGKSLLAPLSLSPSLILTRLYQMSTTVPSSSTGVPLPGMRRTASANCARTWKLTTGTLSPTTSGRR